MLRPDGQQVAFEYDALGRRLSKGYRDQLTRLVWAGHVPLHEWQELATPPSPGEASELTTWVFEGKNLVPAAALATTWARR